MQLHLCYCMPHKTNAKTISKVLKLVYLNHNIMVHIIYENYNLLLRSSGAETILISLIKTLNYWVWKVAS